MRRIAHIFPRLLVAAAVSVSLSTIVRAQTSVPVGESIRVDRAALELPVSAPSKSAETAAFYAVNHATAYASPDSSRPYVALDAREPIRLLRRVGSWAEIETNDGARGFVREEVLSNVWVRVSKTTKTVWVYRGAEVVLTIPADMANNFFLDKQRRGSSVAPDHWRTPEGLYFVVARNAGSRFYKAFVLNYPGVKDGRSGLEEGLISESEYAAIVEADRRFRMPPMTTALGGWIEIHGDGTGSRTTWTRGCVAIPNKSIDILWEMVHVGTPVLIES